jgi:integrase
MKMRAEHIVPLARQAVAMLSDIRLTHSNQKWVFPGPSSGVPMSENTMLFALYRIGYHSKQTVHGFRGLASTVLNEHDFNRDHIERQLAHVPGDAVRAAYNSAQWLPQRRALMQWWADYLDAQLEMAAALG